MAGIHRSSTLSIRSARSATRWGWPGFTAQVHLLCVTVCVTCAGDGRDSPLKYTRDDGVPSMPRRLGMAGIHRSSTLDAQQTQLTRCAGDGRDSPLKYTRRACAACDAQRWGWPGFTAQVHLIVSALHAIRAGDGRDSPLKYTARAVGHVAAALGMAGIHRSSTLSARGRSARSAAGDGRDSPLKYTRQRDASRQHALGMAGIHRSSTLNCSWHRASCAGDGRDSPLKYTRACCSPSHCIGWGWPGFTAQVHCCSESAIRRSGWGWPGFTAQVH